MFVKPHPFRRLPVLCRVAQRTLQIHVLVLALVAAAAFPARAGAAERDQSVIEASFVLYSTGDVLALVKDTGTEKVGIKYWKLDVFFLTIWYKDAKFVLLNDDESAFWELTSEGQKSAVQMYGDASSYIPWYNKWVAWLIWSLIVVCAVCLFIAWIIDSIARRRVRQAFAEHVSDYAKATVRDAGEEVVTQVTGLIAVTDTPRIAIDDVFFDLPADIRATSPDDLRFVLRVRRRKEQIDVTVDKITVQTFQLSWSVQLIDWMRRAIVAETTLIGEPPTKPVTGKETESERTGATPHVAVLTSWIAGLGNAADIPQRTANRQNQAVASKP